MENKTILDVTIAILLAIGVIGLALRKAKGRLDDVQSLKAGSSFAEKIYTSQSLYIALLLEALQLLKIYTDTTVSSSFFADYLFAFFRVVFYTVIAILVYKLAKGRQEK